MYTMKKLGNIVTDYEPSMFSKVFNVVTNIDDIIKGLPTLIVGFYEAKSLIPTFNYYTFKYPEQNMYWMCKKSERRYDYDERLEEFTKECVLHAMRNVKYLYVDIPKYSRGSVMKFARYLCSPDIKVCYISRNDTFAYIYSSRYETVFGISLNLFEYFGIKKQKVLAFMSSNGSNKMLYNTSFIDKDIRRVIGNDVHSIPVLYDSLVD